MWRDSYKISVKWLNSKGMLSGQRGPIAGCRLFKPAPRGRALGYYGALYGLCCRMGDALGTVLSNAPDWQSANLSLRGGTQDVDF